MKFMMIVCIALAVALAAAVVSPASASPERDRCIADGGAWFGEVGCEAAPVRIDRIVVDKSDRLLSAFAGDRLVKRFSVALGTDPVGPKRRQGDGRTPEGLYPIVGHNPASAYHLSLRLGYPTPEQVADARRAGISPGGDIMIHGLPNGDEALADEYRHVDWTVGCIALTNDEIEWLYRYTPDGAQVEVRP